jgi:hypothetical protein
MCFLQDHSNATSAHNENEAWTLRPLIISRKSATCDLTPHGNTVHSVMRARESVDEAACTCFFVYAPARFRPSRIDPQTHSVTNNHVHDFFNAATDSSLIASDEFPTI